MSNSDKINKFLTESFKATGKYFVSKMISSLLIALISYLVFRTLEIELSSLMAAILGITNLVPILGPWAGVIICAVISVFQEPILALYVSLTAIVLQLLEQFLLIPVIAGRALEIKPLLIVIAIILGSLLFGFWGLVFAVPIAAMVKIGYRIFYKDKSE